MTNDIMISRDLTTAIFIDKDKDGVLEVYNVVDEVKAKVAAFKEAVETKKGQDAIRSFAATIASSKTAIEKLGKDCNAELNKQVKATTAVRQKAVADLQAMQDKVRKPLTDIETAEKERKAALQTAIDAIVATGEDCTQNWLNYTAIELGESLVITKGLYKNEWQEFKAVAYGSILESVEKIEAAVDKRNKHDDDQAELDKLRQDAEDAKQKERDDLIAKNAVETHIETTASAPSFHSSRIIPKSTVTYDNFSKSEDEKYVVQENMQKYGGSFVQALGVALTKADSLNTARIMNAFPDYWKEFKNFQKIA